MSELVDQYIAGFEAPVQKRMKELRALVLDIVPEAEEGFGYKMPSYRLNKKPLVYFAGYKHHIGLYAMPQAHENFAKALAGFKQGKGSVQFPHDKEVPWQLIRDMVLHNATMIRSKTAK